MEEEHQSIADGEMGKEAGASVISFGRIGERPLKQRRKEMGGKGDFCGTNWNCL